ncbi:MAG TPA: hypothetical protein DDZ89_02030 [Clostridiales bacterium]|nr:hypothetical protein [Clostridiales bacterium]
MERIFYLHDAWVSWNAGEKFPIAFFGDSTTDGNTTTGYERNQFGKDSLNPNAYSKKLEDRLKEATGNNELRIYNAGFSGTDSNWGQQNFHHIFLENPHYKDVKMIGISFGINDRLFFKDVKSYKESFKKNIKKIIQMCLTNGIQPFLLTTQAVVEPGVTTIFTSQYPLRTTVLIQTIANQVKKELALEMGLELLDVNRFTEEFFLYSSHSLKTIIPDRLHFGDIGHQFEADVLFSLINPQVIRVEDSVRIDHSNQLIGKSIPDDWLTMPEVNNDGFKVYVLHEKDNVDDLNILSVYIFNRAKRLLQLKAVKNSDQSITYVKVNGVKKELTGQVTDLGMLELGLHRLEAYTERSKLTDFKGFLLE